jgi:ribonuclease P protein component
MPDDPRHPATGANDAKGAAAMAGKFALPRSHRLRGRAEFSAVFDARVRASAGPLTVYARPNETSHPRLGITIGRKVGTAPRRNRIKRMLRESFRLLQHDLPAAHDLVVVVRPHEPLQLEQYQQLLRELARRVHAKRR